MHDPLESPTRRLAALGLALPPPPPAAGTYVNAVRTGPLVFLALHLLLTKTRWGTLVRAATEDREMAGALGVNQKALFTGVFALGAALAGLGGALAIPREPASLEVDLSIVADAFVVVVVGGLGSIPGAFLAALLIAVIKAFCIGLGWSKITLAVEFIGKSTRAGRA